MKFGLAELRVDLNGVRASSQTNAVMEGIRHDRRRADTVQQTLAAAIQCGCEFILFPGWTLVDMVPPSWLLRASAGRTIVFECLLPHSAARGAKKGSRPPVGRKGAKSSSSSGPSEVPASCSWHGYVAVSGEIAVGPAPQYVAEASGVWDGDALSPQGAALISALQTRGPAGRRLTVAGEGEAMLLLCGEANLVGGGGPAGCCDFEAVAAADLSSWSLASVPCVGNLRRRGGLGNAQIDDRRPKLCSCRNLLRFLR